MNAQPSLPDQTGARAMQARVTAQLRLLCTTDLHAHLLPYDYFSDQQDCPHGLARVATLIRAARSEMHNTVLLDNGDALQGTPLGDITPQDGSDWGGGHPVIHAMNQLGYDAATLGNHEFNFGLDWLCRALAGAQFPFTCANVTMGGCAPKGGQSPFLSPYLLLRRRIMDDAGNMQPLTLGVIGLVPAQIATWDRMHLHGRLRAHDMIETARTVVPQVRAAGADLIVLLAHTGIDTRPARAMMENAALPLAALPGVDAIMAGHSHDIFPRPVANLDQQSGQSCIDHTRGLLNGTPALMAGARGSHLGVMDLTLRRTGGVWQVIRHRTRVRPTAPPAATPIPGDPQFSADLTPAHTATLRLTRKPIGHGTARLHSYLALAGPNASVAVINALQRRCLAQVVAGTPDADLPLLSAACAFKTGGIGGPLNYTDVPAGPLSLRHAADLYSFPNKLCGLHVTGADLRDWLERAAICFAQITPGAQDAPLLNPSIPGHDFDVIDGLSYAIDLSQPARYDHAGTLINARSRRITDLRHNGRPLADEARFLLASNSYRASGGGPFMAMPDSAFIYTSPRLIRDLLVADLTDTPLSLPTDFLHTWRFAPLPGTTVTLDTGPAVLDDPQALTALNATPIGRTKQGFMRVRIPL
ncbi:bifunctional 2',3'-cyclic-nucleotide 2'-phosphodiesterase/3'-nucleotidase [Rhodobacteraceae bacterium KMM 6894]|nr:bifunctional 2',3'-cyclic-nucleotide 2'-phosphodiesterase/3'-nucleotidase [Rhodobacteraceae bacterium KMM 6894]